MTPADLTDYRARLTRAEDGLMALAERKYGEHLPLDGARLSGKAEGVRLAMSYLNEYEQA